MRTCGWCAYSRPYEERHPTKWPHVTCHVPVPMWWRAQAEPIMLAEKDARECAMYTSRDIHGNYIEKCNEIAKHGG